MNRNNGLREGAGLAQAAQMVQGNEPEQVKTPVEPTDDIVIIDEASMRQVEEATDEPQGEDVMEEAPERSNPREIHIEPLNYGYLVTVGCQKMAIETPEKLSKKLLHYLKNVNAIENEFPRLSFLAD